MSEDDQAHGLFADGQAGVHLKRLHLHYRDRVLPSHRHVAELPVGAKGDVRAVLPDLEALYEFPVPWVYDCHPVVGEVGDEVVATVWREGDGDWLLAELLGVKCLKSLGVEYRVRSGRRLYPDLLPVG